MPLAPEISAFGDGEHSPGLTGITIDGGGFGAFPGSAWIYENSDRSGNSDQLTIDTWNDIQLSVDIPSSLTNIAGTRYLFVQREDLAWSQPFSFSLEIPEEEEEDRPDFDPKFNTVGGPRIRRRIYVVELADGTEVIVESIAQAQKILEDNRPKEQVLPPAEPLPKVSIAMPGQRPSVARLKAPSGMRGMI